MAAQKAVWERFKLEEVLNDASFLGKTVRLGNNIFEVKGVRYSSPMKS
ncbi:MAG: hypothetical protein JW878_06845 [Methanomicrobia archaeon]|nr:hypothetical protein [Methanomicrobia archaeon]